MSSISYLGFRHEAAILPLDRGRDQPGEQRVRPGRPGAQLRVRLGGHEVRVRLARQLDELHQAAVRRGAGEDQAARRDLLAVLVVHLVAVPVPLLDLGQAAVRLADQRALREQRRVQAQPHRAAEVAARDDVHLVGHRGDHRVAVFSSNSAEFGALDPGQVPGALDHHALQAEAQAQDRDLVLPRVRTALILPSMPRTPKPPGMHTASTPCSASLAPPSVVAVVRGHPLDVHPGAVREAAGAQRLGDREVGVRQVDVLADQRDRDLVLRVVHPAQQLVPDLPVHVAERQVEAAHHVGVQALGVQHLRDVVDGRGVGRGGHRLLVHVAHQRDLALDRVRDRPVRAADDRVRLDADASAARPPSAGSAWS